MIVGLLVRRDSTVVSTAGGDVVTYDRAGRLYSAYLRGTYFRRGVDGTVVERHRGPATRRLPPDEARAVTERALAASHGASLEVLEPADLEADARAFREAYEGPVAPLPPDVRRALVVQATVGCAYNACRLCTRYKDRDFRARAPDDFDRHVAAVAEAFGRGVSMRRGVFLGDADALFLETETLVRCCERARTLEPAEQGLYCFGGLFGSRLRSRAGWERLRAAGLRRVYLALDSGNDAVRETLHKPGTATDALRLVRALKGAGLAVGLILTLGTPTESRAAAHVRDSAALVRAAFLDETDVVYLAGDGTDAFREQERALLGAIGDPPPPTGRYDVDGFVY